MTHRENITAQPIDIPSLGIRMALGAGIALLLILAFLLPAGEPNPEWGTFWMVKPLIVVPLAGAVGGALYYFITLRFQHGWSKVLATIFSVIVFIFLLWIGTVIGLNGTYWN